MPVVLLLIFKYATEWLRIHENGKLDPILTTFDFPPWSESQSEQRCLVQEVYLILFLFVG
jgi:hypothetical protein